MGRHVHCTIDSIALWKLAHTCVWNPPIYKSKVRVFQLSGSTERIPMRSCQSDLSFCTSNWIQQLIQNIIFISLCPYRGTLVGWTFCGFSRSLPEYSQRTNQGYFYLYSHSSLAPNNIEIGVCTVTGLWLPCSLLNRLEFGGSFKNSGHCSIFFLGQGVNYYWSLSLHSPFRPVNPKPKLSGSC